jgi:hypothetical protein
MDYTNLQEHIATFRLGSSFPANANNSVVFPELGGPKSKVNL